MESLLNIYICLIAPLLLMLVILKGQNRILNLFLIIGMTACLLSAYANSKIIVLSEYNLTQATYYISPILEEVIKAFPIFVYIIFFKTKSESIITAALATGIGFATLENCYYIMVYGASNSFFLLMRGFATGVMHGICTAIIGFGFAYIYNKKILAVTGAFGLLCCSITYHATYNLLISSSGITFIIGIFLPIVTAMVIVILIYKPYRIIYMIKSLKGKKL